jgi:hypothetical protein
VNFDLIDLAAIFFILGCMFGGAVGFGLGFMFFDKPIILEVEKKCATPKSTPPSPSPPV